MKTIETIVEDVARREGADPEDIEEELGHYVAMEALGHGVSWEDDHVPHRLWIPPWEFFEEIELEEEELED